MYARNLLRLAAMTSTAFLAGSALADQPKTQPEKFKQLDMFRRSSAMFRRSPDTLKKAA